MEKEEYINKAHLSEMELQRISNLTLQDCCQQMTDLFDHRKEDSLDKCNQLYHNALEKVKREVANEVELFNVMRPFAEALADSCCLTGFKLPLAALDDTIALGERLASEHPEIHIFMPKLIEYRHNNIYSDDNEESAKHTDDYRQMFRHYRAAGENDGIIQRKAIDCLARIVNALSLSERPENHAAAKQVEIEMLEYIDEVLSRIQHPLLLHTREERRIPMLGDDFVSCDFSMICPNHSTKEIQERTTMIDQMIEKYPYATEFLTDVKHSIMKRRTKKQEPSE